jgi:hypothetical protein
MAALDKCDVCQINEPSTHHKNEKAEQNTKQWMRERERERER